MRVKAFCKHSIQSTLNVKCRMPGNTILPLSLLIQRTPKISLQARYIVVFIPTQFEKCCIFFLLQMLVMHILKKRKNVKVL